MLQHSSHSILRGLDQLEKALNFIGEIKVKAKKSQKNKIIREKTKIKKTTIKSKGKKQ